MIAVNMMSFTVYAAGDTVGGDKQENVSDNGDSDSSGSDNSDDGGSDAGADQGGSDTGSDQGGSDAGSDQGGSDTGSDQGGSDAGSDQGGSDAGSDQGGSDTGSDQGGSGAGSGQSTDTPSGDQTGNQQSGSSESTPSGSQSDAQEDKGSGDDTADQAGNQDNAGAGSSAEATSGQSESGNENKTEEKGSEDTGKTDNASGAATEDKTGTEVKTESAADGTSTSTADSSSEKKTEEKTETKDAATQSNSSSTDNKSTDKDADKQSGTDKAAGAATEETQKEETAPTDEEIDNMLNKSKRRTAVKTQESSSSSDSSSDSSSSSESWSNDPVIEDVMGIKASVQDGNVVISYKTKHSNPWEYLYNQYPITISYADGNGTNNNNTISFDWDGFGIHGDNWSQIDGVTISKSSDQNDTEYVTLTIPASWFESMDFTLSSGKYSTSISGEPIEQDDSQNDAVYEGIALDGTFNDWDAVAKSTLNEPNNEHNVEEVAWVIEKDYVYIYIKDDGSNSATWAGPNHNGKYAITTDLGRTLVFQLTEDGAVVGADGAVSNHTGSQWEIAIPTSSLPNNNGGLNFGLYLTDSTLDGYGDVSTPTSSTDIAYDGHYGDWDNYPHKEIQYATAGTHENVPDGEAAIYVDNNVYGHCETRMQAHLDEKGGEYTQAVSVIVNDDWSHALQMRLVTVDSAGNINWNPQRSEMENGAYEYYIFGIDCWGSSQNINNLVDADVCYGKATVTLQDGRHDMEWYVDSAKLAARYGILETDMKTVSSQYGRIGQQLVTSAGASSGPYAGAGLCIMSALVPFVIKKKFRFE